MLVTVARDTSQSVFTLMDEPLWRALYVFHHLQEQDERRRCLARMERVDLGYLVALAYHESGKLAQEHERAAAALAALDQPRDRSVDLEQLASAGDGLAARIARTRAIEPEALVP